MFLGGNYIFELEYAGGSEASKSRHFFGDGSKYFPHVKSLNMFSISLPGEGYCEEKVQTEVMAKLRLFLELNMFVFLFFVVC